MDCYRLGLLSAFCRGLALGMVFMDSIFFYCLLLLLFRFCCILALLFPGIHGFVAADANFGPERGEVLFFFLS
jgi:hypothetical protein